MSNELYYTKRIIPVFGELEYNLAQEIVLGLLEYNAQDSHAPIIMLINSPGGIAESFFGIYDVMKYISNPIVTVAVGDASSAAAFLLASGTPNLRFASENSSIMIHQLQLAMGDSFTTVNDLSVKVSDFNGLNDKLISIVSKLTKQSKERLKKDMEKDLYLKPKEAQNYGIIDHIGIMTDKEFFNNISVIVPKVTKEQNQPSKSRKKTTK